MLNSGILHLYEVSNQALKGMKPKECLVILCDCYYEERVIGVTRFYAAAGANRQVDALVRIYPTEEALPGNVVVLEDGKQYRIDAIQKVYEDGLPMTDLSLVRMEKLYEYAIETP